jgi:hypothetical protein
MYFCFVPKYFYEIWYHGNYDSGLLQCKVADETINSNKKQWVYLFTLLYLLEMCGLCKI